MSAKWLFTFKHFKFPLLPLLTHSGLVGGRGESGRSSEAARVNHKKVGGLVGGSGWLGGWLRCSSSGISSSKQQAASRRQQPTPTLLPSNISQQQQLTVTPVLTFDQTTKTLESTFFIILETSLPACTSRWWEDESPQRRRVWEKRINDWTGVWINLFLLTWIYIPFFSWNKLASSVDAIAISKVWKHFPLIDWSTDRSRCWEMLSRPKKKKYIGQWGTSKGASPANANKVLGQKVRGETVCCSISLTTSYCSPPPPAVSNTHTTKNTTKNTTKTQPKSTRRGGG